MQVQHFHSWDVTPKEAIQIQQQLRAKVIPHGKVATPSLIAGADVAFVEDTAVACVVLLTFPKLEIVETVVHKEKVSFPYIPGLLSFRETPAVAQAFGKLKHRPDLIFIDGQGLAHPRAAGIACHMGVILDRPTIGCAKSLLFGTYKEPKEARGSVSDLCDDEGKVIGAVVRTKDGVQPVFISIGHKIDLAQAIEFTLACGKGYRIPEPTRQADLLAERAKHEDVQADQGGQGELF
ncbi:MAG TPA: deoxyribonuclease V [Nitrospirales bacterium]|nr:deoxyribonuclease V [Nitrospirales bacterium]